MCSFFNKVNIYWGVGRTITWLSAFPGLKLLLFYWLLTIHYWSPSSINPASGCVILLYPDTPCLFKWQLAPGCGCLHHLKYPHIQPLLVVTAPNSTAKLFVAPGCSNTNWRSKLLGWMQSQIVIISLNHAHNHVNLLHKSTWQLYKCKSCDYNSRSFGTLKHWAYAL